jgi:hypothetical protein
MSAVAVTMLARAFSSCPATQCADSYMDFSCRPIGRSAKWLYDRRDINKQEELAMTNRIGNKNVAQLRGKQERKETKEANRAREATKRAEARAKYRNAVKGQPLTASA